MNRSESKYFNTARRMDEALLQLLEKKEFAYITVKEICEQAQVNRSTFYLHYETMDDLLSESVTYLNARFQEHMKPEAAEMVSRLSSCPIEELYLVTPTYLLPYLTCIRQHKRLFRTALRHASLLRLDEVYAQLFQNVFTPILNRFQVPEGERAYMLAFYIHGMMAIITQWLENECRDDVEMIAELIQRYVMRSKER